MLTLQLHRCLPRFRHLECVVVDYADSEAFLSPATTKSGRIAAILNFLTRGNRDDAAACLSILFSNALAKLTQRRNPPLIPPSILPPSRSPDSTQFATPFARDGPEISRNEVFVSYDASFPRSRRQIDATPASWASQADAYTTRCSLCSLP